MNPNYLDFEQPIADLEAKIEELRMVGNDTDINITDEISRLKKKSIRCFLDKLTIGTEMYGRPLLELETKEVMLRCALLILTQEWG